jgi:hypothetical protein
MDGTLELRDIRRVRKVRRHFVHCAIEFDQVRAQLSGGEHRGRSRGLGTDSQ